MISCVTTLWVVILGKVVVVVNIVVVVVVIVNVVVHPRNLPLKFG